MINTSTDTGTAQQQQHTKCAEIPPLTVWRPAAWRWRRYRAVVQAWSIATGKTCLRLRQPLRFPGSIASFFDRRAQTTSVPPGAKAFTAGPVDIPATASAAAVRTTAPVRADVTATAPDAEALSAELLVCGEPECENQPCFAEPGQTTVLSHPLLPAWSVGAKTCNPLPSHPLLSHPARLV